MDCILSEPLNFEGQPPADGQPFAYSKSTCTTAEEAVPEKTFFINKSISYGDICIYTMLFIVVLFFTIKFAWNLTHQNPAEKL